MSVRQRAFVWSLALLALFVFNATSISAQDAAPAAPAAAAPEDKGGIEEIIVTSRKKEESIQDIPIAVSAFSGDDLATSNIDDVADVQFNVPNLVFSKTNFSGAGNISLRGVGNLATAATSEAGVGIHINEAPFGGARIFETEFYDVDRVEVLRGPQGTLFGRSAPGGTLNIYTKKPVFGEWGGYIQPEYGKFNHGKIRAGVNIPLGEHFAFRGAGYYFHRDGITDNVAAGHGDIDGRDVYALRGSLAGEWDDVDFNLMVQWFSKNDSTMRINKQACTEDTRGFPFSIGCQGGNVKLGHDAPNYSSTLAYSLGAVIDTFHVLGLAGVPGFSPNIRRFLSGPIAMYTPYIAPGLEPIFGYLLPNAVVAPVFGPATLYGGPSYGAPLSYFGGGNPRSLREVSTPFDPRYKADEFETTFEVNFKLSETLTLSSVSGYHRANVDSATDYFWASPSVGFDGVSTPAACLANPACMRHFDFPKGVFKGGRDVGSDFVFDHSTSTDDIFTQEVRVASSLDGPFNYIAGAIFTSGEGSGNYDVYSASLESIWDLPGDPLGFCSFDANGFNVTKPESHGMPGVPGASGVAVTGPRAPGQGNTSCHDIDPSTSFYRNESKPTRSQNYAIFAELYYDLFEKTRVTVGARYTDDLKTAHDRVNLWVCDGTAISGSTKICSKNPFQDRRGGWTNVTWKVSLDQHFDLPFAPDSLVYATVSTGYKGGGFNPAVDTEAGGTPVSLTFDEEDITAYEVGFKGILFDRMIFNMTGFYYDYSGMQISKIVNRTAVNENVDSEIYGVEVETVYEITEALRLDLNASWLGTKITNGSSIDTADPTAGNPLYEAIKQQYVAATDSFGNEIIDPVRGLPFAAAFPAAQNGICNRAVNPGCLDPGLSYINQGAAQPVAGSFIRDGLPTSLNGKELPSSPAVTIKVGLQYIVPIFKGWEMTPRVDYYWHDKMFGRIYNTKKDEIASWGQVDAQMSFTKEGTPFTVELWAKNLQDNDDVTGQYFTDATSGNFTNLFILEPRTFGASVRYTFGESEL